MVQVCAIEWSIHDKEFVSSHGFTHNQLILWRYMGNGRVQKITELTGHQARSLLVKIVECTGALIRDASLFFCAFV